MATEITQLPAVTPVSMIIGDGFSWSMRINRALTDYTFTTSVYSITRNSYTGVTSVDVAFTPALQVTVNTTTNQTTVLHTVAAGQTSGLSPNGSYRWYLRWTSPGGVPRTIASGKFIASLP